MWALGSNPALPSPPLKTSAICDDKIIPVAKHSNTSHKRMEQEDVQFEGSLFYTMKFFLKKNNNKT